MDDKQSGVVVTGLKEEVVISPVQVHVYMLRITYTHLHKKERNRENPLVELYEKKKEKKQHAHTPPYNPTTNL
jgi:hypothetical protein